MTATSERDISWNEADPTRTVALNVGGRYLTLAAELLLGLVLLPFNMRHLGMSELRRLDAGRVDCVVLSHP